MIGLLVCGVGFGGAFGVLLWCACFGLVIWWLAYVCVTNSVLVLCL